MAGGLSEFDNSILTYTEISTSMDVRHLKTVQSSNYSERPKSVRSDFGVFRFGSIVKQFQFQTVSKIRTKRFRFQTFGLALILGPNGTNSLDFRHCLKLEGFCTVWAIRNF